MGGKRGKSLKGGVRQHAKRLKNEKAEEHVNHEGDDDLPILEASDSEDDDDVPGPSTKSIPKTKSQPKVSKTSDKQK